MQIPSARFLVPIALLAAAAGCSNGDNEATATTEAFVSPIPTVPAADQDALVEGLDAIAPGLATEPEDTLTNARNTCDSILGGSQSLVESTKVRFEGDGVDSMSDDQAQQIVDFIGAQDWCV